MKWQSRLNDSSIATILNSSTVSMVVTISSNARSNPLRSINNRLNQRFLISFSLLNPFDQAFHFLLCKSKNSIIIFCVFILTLTLFGVFRHCQYYFTPQERTKRSKIENGTAPAETILNCGTVKLRASCHRLHGNFRSSDRRSLQACVSQAVKKRGAEDRYRG